MANRSAFDFTTVVGYVSSWSNKKSPCQAAPTRVNTQHQNGAPGLASVAFAVDSIALDQDFQAERQCSSY